MDPHLPNYVYRLKKALYGLKQAKFERFRSSMVKKKYKQCQANHTLFMMCQGDMVIALIVYVDDIVVTGNNEAKVKRLRSAWSKSLRLRI